MGLLRLILSLTVAGDHLFAVVLDPHGYGTRGVDQWIWLNAGTAVMLFYVISGFLISYVLAHKYDATLNGAIAFYRSRFIRIFSLYWPMLAIASIAFPGDGPRTFVDHIVSLIIVGGDWLLPFAAYPVEYNPYYGVLGPVWTVASELTFYAMAPFVLRSFPLTVCLFTLSLLLHFVLHRLMIAPDVIYHFFPASLFCFLAGDLARRMAERHPSYLGTDGMIALGGAVMFLRLTMLKGGTFGPFFYPLIGCFALSLPWLFEKTKDNRMLNFLGDLTYPIYLTHSMVIALIFSPYAARFGIAPVPLFVAVFFVSAAMLGTIVRNPVQRGHRYQRKADSNPVIADSM